MGKYTVLAHLVFFFNSVLLPKGLLYSQLLGPFFYRNALRRGKSTWLLPFLAFLIPYDILHLIQGVDVLSFLNSNALFFLTYLSVMGIYHFICDIQQPEKIMGQVLLFNGLLVLIALPFFFLPKPYQEWMWYVKKITGGTSEFPRLALFTYEASYYALLLTPVFVYFLLDLFMNNGQKHRWLTFSLCVVPLILSLSFGVIGAILLAALLVSIVWLRTIFKSNMARSVFVGSILIGLLGFWILLQFPENIVAIRINNILEGKDTSANGRTSDSFKMAWLIADMKSLWFGGGLGQIKHLVVEVVHQHFKYWGDFPRYDIPNAMGETLAIFGIIGVIIRLILEAYLFFKTKVYSNYYRLLLFCFIFIYQFTGSFITNIAEYICWCIAFSPAFKQFDVKRT